jgi:hypothetical protein
VDPRPCSAAEAVERALQYVGKTTYKLGAGGYKLAAPDAPPWGSKGGVTFGLDCSGFATWCYRLPRTRLPFARGPGSRVADAINTDSIVFDAENARELFEVVTTPALGDLLVYPGLWQAGSRTSIGHVGIVTGVPAEWDPAAPQYQLLQVTHCSPSSAARKWPTGIKTTDGGIWRDRKGKARTRVVRVVP